MVKSILLVAIYIMIYFMSERKREKESVREVNMCQSMGHKLQLLYCSSASESKELFPDQITTYFVSDLVPSSLHVSLLLQATCVLPYLRRLFDDLHV